MKNSEQPINPIVMENTLPGLTKREYFAGLAMQGMLANSYPDTMGFNEEQIAKIAINYTDELLKQLQND